MPGGAPSVLTIDYLWIQCLVQSQHASQWQQGAALFILKVRQGAKNDPLSLLNRVEVASKPMERWVEPLITVVPGFGLFHHSSADAAFIRPGASLHLGQWVICLLQAGLVIFLQHHLADHEGYPFRFSVQSKYTSNSKDKHHRNLISGGQLWAGPKYVHRRPWGDHLWVFAMWTGTATKSGKMTRRPRNRLGNLKLSVKEGSTSLFTTWRSYDMTSYVS